MPLLLNDLMLTNGKTYLKLQEIPWKRCFSVFIVKLKQFLTLKVILFSFMLKLRVTSEDSFKKQPDYF